MTVIENTKNYPIVFIQGMLKEQGHWGDFKSIIIDTFPHRECIFLDVPGSGELHFLNSPSSIRKMTLHLINQLEKYFNNRSNINANLIVEASDKVYLVGLSMGGMIALDWASFAPERVESVIAVNTSISNFSSVFERLQPKAWMIILSVFFSSLEEREKKIFELSSSLSSKYSQHQLPINTKKLTEQTSNIDNVKAEEVIKEKTVIQWVSLAKKNPISIRSGFNQLLASARFKLKIKPDVPITLITSVHDQVAATQCSEAIALGWESELIRHSWAGHDLFLDDPVWLSSVIKEKIT